jgi:hypothetical protein
LVGTFSSSSDDDEDINKHLKSFVEPPPCPYSKATWLAENSGADGSQIIERKQGGTGHRPAEQDVATMLFQNLKFSTPYVVSLSR